MIYCSLWNEMKAAAPYALKRSACCRRAFGARSERLRVAGSGQAAPARDTGCSGGAAARFRRTASVMSLLSGRCLRAANSTTCADSAPASTRNISARSTTGRTSWPASAEAPSMRLVSAARKGTPTRRTRARTAESSAAASRVGTNGTQNSARLRAQSNGRGYGAGSCQTVARRRLPLNPTNRHRHKSR